MYLTEREVSELTKIAIPTLRNDRSQGRGIPYIKIRKSVRYNKQEVLDYMEAHRQTTSVLTPLQDNAAEIKQRTWVDQLTEIRNTEGASAAVRWMRNNPCQF